MADGSLSSKVMLISGGASGIGFATARLAVARGARVALGDVQGDKGMAAARELGEQAMFVDLDVTQEAAWRCGESRPDAVRRADHGGQFGRRFDPGQH